MAGPILPRGDDERQAGGAEGAQRVDHRGLGGHGFPAVWQARPGPSWARACLSLVTDLAGQRRRNGMLGPAGLSLMLLEVGDEAQNVVFYESPDGTGGIHGGDDGPVGG